MEVYIILIFLIGYLVIALEQPLKVSKVTIALAMGTLCWSTPQEAAKYAERVNEIGREILFAFSQVNV